MQTRIRILGTHLASEKNDTKILTMKNMNILKKTK